jgi:hypothetical protein
MVLAFVRATGKEIASCLFSVENLVFGGLVRTIEVIETDFNFEDVIRLSELNIRSPISSSCC